VLLTNNNSLILLFVNVKRSAKFQRSKSKANCLIIFLSKETTDYEMPEMSRQ